MCIRDSGIIKRNWLQARRDVKLNWIGSAGTMGKALFPAQSDKRAITLMARRGSVSGSSLFSEALMRYRFPTHETNDWLARSISLRIYARRLITGQFEPLALTT